MKYHEKPTAILLLEDGRIFYGKAAGKIGTATGEICFNTGMTGYQETFTDPSYLGQIIVTTNAHIGNYGVQADEVESDTIKIAGLICKNFNDGYSRARADSSLQDYFVRDNIVSISDVDTRAIVRHIRDKGVMNALISSDETDIEKLKVILSKVPSMEGLELSSKVTTAAPYFVGNENARYKVALLDLGSKKNIIHCLVERDCYVKVFPMHTDLEEMKEWNPDGFLISNGPGDPSVMPETVRTVAEIVESDLPLFGICLGHQILATAMGLSTYKMHRGHRGINHPVKNLLTGKCEITSQNHGFEVSMEDATKNEDIEITHVHINDNTIAGLSVRNRNAFSVQYHPEASAGPHDSRYLFDQFINNMKKAPKKIKLEKA